jgi:hypothetical protein
MRIQYGVITDMKTYPTIALGVPDILLPKSGVDPAKWAVIACDQHTSEPQYWERVKMLVGDAPSSLNLIYPEAYLGEPDSAARIGRIREMMNRYLESGLFEETAGLVYVERSVGSWVRKGIVACLDLEHYDFRPGSTSLIRASEGTILERLPPRVRIREGASLEIPHIMVLVDDPENRVFGPVTQGRNKLTRLYDFDLMFGSGHLSGFRIDDPAVEAAVISGLTTLAVPENFVQKYGLPAGTPVLLFAMGDGNHSLATAKTIWEKTGEKASDKQDVMNSPLRYALVELVNLHDEALVFEPIHRVLLDLAPGKDICEDFQAFYTGNSRYSAVSSLEEMKAVVDSQTGNAHKIGLVSASGFGLLEIERPSSVLPVGTLQSFLDEFLKKGGARGIDYVHGAETVVKIGRKGGSLGLYLPAMNKHDLFKTVILDGALPRKTFSMGEAWEKRFYMEARRLT